MSLYVGINNSPRNIVGLLVGSNGVKEVQSAYTGGVNSRNLVYKSMPEVDRALTKVNPVDILTSGKITKNDIGKTVYLSNSAITCQEWRIADVNHDNTSGTVDLFPRYVFDFCDFFDGYGGTNQYANANTVHSYLNKVCGGFSSEVQNALKLQTVQINQNYSIQEKIKCPSLIEVGCRDGYMIFDDVYDASTGSYITIFRSVADVTPSYGSIYPIFGSAQSNPNTLSIYNTTGNIAKEYWTRDPVYRGNANVAYIDANGTPNYTPYSGTGYHYIGCIRF